MPLVADISRNALDKMTSLYNVDLVNHQMRSLGLTIDQLADRAGFSIPTAHTFLAGQLGTLKKLKRGTDALLIKWKYITSDLRPQQFHLAVLTNGSRTRRSVKSRPVYGSANRPRSKELKP